MTTTFYSCLLRDQTGQDYRTESLLKYHQANHPNSPNRTSNIKIETKYKTN